LYVGGTFYYTVKEAVVPSELTSSSRALMVIVIEVRVVVAGGLNVKVFLVESYVRKEVSVAET